MPSCAKRLVYRSVIVFCVAHNALVPGLQRAALALRSLIVALITDYDAPYSVSAAFAPLCALSAFCGCLVLTVDTRSCGFVQRPRLLYLFTFSLVPFCMIHPRIAQNS